MMKKYFNKKALTLLLFVLACCCEPCFTRGQDRSGQEEVSRPAAPKLDPDVVKGHPASSIAASANSAAASAGSAADGADSTAAKARETAPAAKSKPRLKRLVESSSPASALTMSVPTAQSSSGSESVGAMPPAPQFLYERALRSEDFADLSKTKVLKMQRDMGKVFQSYPDWGRDVALPRQPLDDGKVGAVTLFWLQRYCFHFKVAPHGKFGLELPHLINRMVEFGKKWPDELTILLGAEFAAWDEAQSEPQRSSDFQVRARGSEEELLALLRRFRLGKTTNSRSPESSNSTKSGTTGTNDKGESGTVFYWSLGSDDIRTLGSKDQIVAALSQLKDKKFESKEALKVATITVLNQREDFNKDLWPLISRQIILNTGYRVNDASLAKVRQAKFPDAVIKGLEQLKDSYYPDKVAFETSVVDAVQGTGESATVDLEQIETLMEVHDSVVIDEQALINIKKDLQHNIVNTGLPATVTKLLAELKDASYPELSLFQSAVQTKLMVGLAACPKNLSQSNQYVTGLRLPDDELALLETEFTALADATKTGHIDVRQAFVVLRNLRARQSPCNRAELDNMNEVIKGLYTQFLATTVESVARRKPVFNNQPVNWNGSGCGCVLDDLSGPVVGFYPFWQNPDGKPQNINFSVLSRVEYGPLTFDDWGELKHANDTGSSSSFLGNEDNFDFVRTAHTFRSQIDWLVQRQDWTGDWAGFERERKQAVLKKMAGNILNWVQTPLEERYFRGKPGSSLGPSTVPRRGDGVTLYFPNYPTDKASKDVFNAFYLSLKKSLSAHGLWLNLVVPRQSLAEPDSAFGLSNLIQLFRSNQRVDGAEKSGRAPFNGYFIVLLEAPTSDSKKMLRLDIENGHGLRGVERVDFLRNVVTVINFDQRNWQQVDDDIVYAKDNFGGMGFWPLPQANLNQPLAAATQSCVAVKQLALCLMQHFQADGVKAELPSWLARVVCENRGYLAILLYVFLLLDVILLVLVFKSCAAQSMVRDYFLWVVLVAILPPVLIFILVLFFDPSLSTLSKGNLPFIIAVALIIFGMIVGYLYLRSQREKPRRQYTMPARQRSRSAVGGTAPPHAAGQASDANAAMKTFQAVDSADNLVREARTSDERVERLKQRLARFKLWS